MIDFGTLRERLTVQVALTSVSVLVDKTVERAQQKCW